jgi:UDP-3-O-[3-hydroxymyristoyl] glucosamine N-acyltransferase
LPKTLNFFNLHLLAFQIGLFLPAARDIFGRTFHTPQGRKDAFVTISLGQLAALVQGKVIGDPEIAITSAKPVGEARAGDITFIEKEKYVGHLHGCQASAAVVPVSVPANGMAVIQVADPLAAFVTIVQHLQGRPTPRIHGIDPKAAVHATARVGPDASICPFAVIGEGTVVGARCRIHSGVVIGQNCRLGDDVTLYPNCVLYEGTILGNRVTVHANAVIGADGFGYRFHEGRHVQVPQLGYVEIGDDVEIGACTTIDRGTFGATRIGAGTKIDNLVMIGHNCRLGKHNLLCGQVGFAGSCSTDDYVVAAGQVGLADHLHIGAGAVLGAQCGLAKDVPAGQRVIGSPALPEHDQKRIFASMARLPDMRRDLRKIKQHLGIKDEE